MMQIGAYYNEIDPFKSEVLREAIQAGAIAPGDVDERSIVDVEPADLMGYAQCHFFAGGGFWSVALRQAGWPDDRPVWTGSTPCPSFSAAGKGQGFDDPRHLWPAWARLIRECHPSTIFGEQVSAAIGHGWLDLVQTDLEAQNYAVGKIVLGAASVGAPHIRQRLYFVAQSQCPAERRRGLLGPGEGGEALGAGASTQSFRRGVDCLMADTASSRCEPSRDGSVEARPTNSRSEYAGELPLRTPGCGADGILVDAEGGGLGMCGSAQGKAGHTAQPSESGDLGNPCEQRLSNGQLEEFCGTRRGQEGRATAKPSETVGGLGISESERRQSGPARNEVDGEGMESTERKQIEPAAGSKNAGSMAEPLHAERWPFDVDGQDGRDGEDARRQEAHDDFGTCSEVRGASPLNGFWRDADWIGCRDGKFRPVESGSFPLAHGSAARVGRLRLYGDAICIPAAQAFIEAYLEAKSAKKQG